jgi:hypothetical protein
MVVNTLKNISDKRIIVKLTNGTEMSIPSGVSIGKFDVKNLDEIRDNVKITEDLTEVNSSSGKTKLYD